MFNVGVPALKEIGNPGVPDIQRIPSINLKSCLLRCSEYNTNRPYGFNDMQQSLCKKISVNEDFCFLKNNQTGWGNRVENNCTDSAILELRPSML